MKRLFLFLLTNLAAVVMLTVAAAVICMFFGVDLGAALGEGGYAPLFVFSFLFGMAGSLISLCLSKKIVKVSMKCRTITGQEGEAERWLVSTVEDLARRANLKTPEVAIYPGAANAFATGARKNAALVAVSTDIMGQMTREELRGVLAHEMTHVANGDMVTMGLTQGVVNTFVIFFSHIAAQIIQGALGGRGERRSRGGYGLYHLIVSLMQLVLGLLASVVLMWYSRRREFAADAGSARLLGSPAPMIAALRRLGNLTPGVLPDSLRAFGVSGKHASLFASHPSLEDRIEALMNLPPDTAA